MRGDEPLREVFVNRVTELARFEHLLAQLSDGRRQHTALLGLRRIGKSALLDEFRVRHATEAISYLAVDEVTSSPSDFALAWADQLLRSATRADHRTSPLDLTTAAPDLQGEVARTITRLRDLAGREQSNGALLTLVFRLPHIIAEQLNRPLVVMLDEFQEITRLQRFPNTDNLLGAVRAALDRRGRVAYVVAGSRVTALRTLLQEGESPLFTRFEQMEIGPFTPEATADLVDILCQREEVGVNADAPARVHRLGGGWPFYTTKIIGRAARHARAAGTWVTGELVDLAFEEELIGRSGDLGQQCRYLLATATQTVAPDISNTVDAVLRAVAVSEPVRRAALAEALARDHAERQVYRAVDRLIEIDILREQDGLLVFWDGVFSLWLRLGPTLRDPTVLRANPDARRRLLGSLEARLGESHQTVGELFERRVENVVRQFHGQVVDGSLFGMEGQIELPVVREAGKIRRTDPQARLGDRPDTYEVDIATFGDSPDDCWTIEAKHQVGAITVAMVERYLRNVAAIERLTGHTFARRWLVAPRGIRADAQELARAQGILFSGRRALDRLERILRESFETRLQPHAPLE